MSTTEAVGRTTDVGSESLDRFADYLSAVVDASNRVIRVIASLLAVGAIASISLLSTMHNSWTRKRIAALRDAHSVYLSQYIGPPPPQTSSEWELYKIRYAAFYAPLAKAQADTLTAQKTPIPSAPDIDINYVGVVFGLVFLAGMTSLAYALSAQHRNMTHAFDWAARTRTLADMQRLISMRQVVEPQAQPGIMAQFAIIVPVIVYTAIIFEDYRTMGLGSSLGVDNRIIVLMGMELISLSTLSLLTVRVLRNAYAIAALWNQNQRLMTPKH